LCNWQAAFIHQLTCSDKPTCEAAEATPGQARHFSGQIFATFYPPKNSPQNGGEKYQGIHPPNPIYSGFGTIGL